MGIRIHLDVQVHHIDSGAWKNVYDESLLLLQRFPASLLRVEVCEVGKYRRYQTTDEIVCNQGTDEECWQVSGDRASGRRAESFCLHRHLQNHLPEQLGNGSTMTESNMDILWAGDQDIDWPGGAGVDVFGNKTQGCPYHLALLAVGILFENRFPGRCLVHGHFDRQSVEQTLLWVNAVLDTDYKLPVCLDGSRLYARLSSLFQDQQHVIKRFNAMYLGSQLDALSTLVACAAPEELKRHLIAELGCCDSLSQLRAIWMLSAYLEATQDVDRLIDLVLATPKFRAESTSLEALLKILCRRFVTIDPVERKPLFALNPPVGQLATIDDVFRGRVQMLSGVPAEIQFYMSRSDLLGKFAERDPELRGQFEEIVAAEEAACRKALAEIDAALTEVSASGEPSEVDCSISQPDVPVPGEHYLLQQIERQRKVEVVELPETVAENLGAAVSKALRIKGDSINAVHPDHYRKLIDWAGQQNSIVLWREAWEAIDREKELTLLKALAVLMLINQWEATFCKWRIHVLEHKRLWPYLISSLRKSDEEDHDKNCARF